MDETRFGDWFKPAMKAAGYRSYRQFAERAGVSLRYNEGVRDFIAVPHVARV